MDLAKIPVAVNFTLVDSDAGLAECCERWQYEQALALDTEFMRVSTFYPKVGLIQIADEKLITLIDPLQINNWQPFADLMLAPNLVKIFHSCSEDLLVFFSFLKLLPFPVFDTQIAGAMLNEGVSLSYQNLVKKEFDIELPKAETRSDWLQRPLTIEQLDYAALDVAFLYRTWQAQTKALQALGREQWLKEDCARVLQQYECEFTEDFSDYYLNFKSGWQLGPQQLLTLKMLAEWREQRARKRDKPRSWIIKDNALFAMATDMVTTKGQLATIEEVSDNFIRYEGGLVIDIIREASTAADDQCPAPISRPLTSAQKTRLKNAQEVIEAKAVAMNIPPEILGRKRTLLALLYALQHHKDEGGNEALHLPDELRGWRGPVLLDDLTQVLQP
ncbi:MAG: ribonuclease D [Pseudomonadota bacterium]